MERNGPITRLRYFLFGKPKDLSDRSVYHHLALIPFLAWVGLGADGLSSSSYGPDEAFRALAEHRYLAVLLAALMAFTVIVISAAYRRIIDEFPHGGGGYVVASKLLGRKTGLVSGCALLVDYILTITISVAAAGDAVFSFLPLSWQSWKLGTEISIILILSAMNLRGVKESVKILTPIFIVFLITHLIAIIWGIVGHIPEMPTTAQAVAAGFHEGSNSIGWWAMIIIFVRAYSLGGGAYTGIEAVSNGVMIMREPRVVTAKRTMTYMALSLAFTASGLLLCYLLWKVAPVEGKTLNAVLFENMFSQYPFGSAFIIVTLFAEGMLLVVAAQAGFIDGPRVLANMAVDSWVPRRFAALSEQLTTANGVVLMGASSLAALLYTGGSVSKLVVMYSINVFLTFSLSIFGMLLNYLRRPKETRKVGHKRSVLVFALGFILCLTILVITVIEKFLDGGWVTLVVTGALVALCLAIKSHYLEVAQKLHKLFVSLDRKRPNLTPTYDFDPKAKTAAILVGGYGGLGIHTVQTILETFPDVFKNLVFVSVGVLDSGKFKGEEGMENLKADTAAMLQKYVDLGRSYGVASEYRMAIGTDVVHEGVELCERVKAECPQATFFTGKIIFQDEAWFHRILHNETGFSLQKRLQLAGLTMVILPTRVV